MKLKQLLSKHNQLGAIVALSSASLSLLLSTYYSLAPCTLCYWQRIFMYPLVFIFVGALWRDDKRTYIYSLPLAIGGAGLALYHYSLQMGWITLAESCVSGVSCTDTYIEYLGFFTIPFGALLGFVAIIVISIRQWQQSKSLAAKTQGTDFMRRIQPVVIVVLAIVFIATLALETIL